MNKLTIIPLFIVAFFVPATVHSAQPATVQTTKETPSVIYRWGVNFKPEVFGAFHFNEFNKCNSFDEVVFVRQTFDAFANIQAEFVEFKGALRNRVTWGNAIAKTSEGEFKLFGAVTGHHKHEVGRLYPWFRELWLKFDLGKALGLSFIHKHE
ncbi:MAG TPA: hypothetical protein VLG71_02945, partial [Candidatus Limnocylindria bacterium]|nr:hypothetical protein [Candidatus Limnocylindria bacterium]